jgi:hypothetical protein
MLSRASLSRRAVTTISALAGAGVLWANAGADAATSARAEDFNKEARMNNL